MNHADAVERFNQTVWPHREAVLRAALIHCGDPAEAEDLAQETLFKAFKSIGTFRPGTAMRAWLMTILRHARIDRLRKSSGPARPLSLDALPGEPAGREAAEREFDPSSESPADLLNAFSDADVIRALQQVPEEIRWTLLLADVEQMDQADAAAVLGVPIGTVKSRLSRGRAMLRQALLPLARDRRLVRE